VSLTAKQFHYAFGNTLTEEESDALHDAWTIPGAGLPLFSVRRPGGATVASNTNLCNT
jgi:hypothetical protein